MPLDLVFPGEGGSVLCVGAADGLDPLRVAIKNIATGRRAAVAHPDLPSPRRSNVDMLSSAVRNILQELKQEHKVVAVCRVVSLLQQTVECDEAVAKNTVIMTMRALSEEGEALYFGYAAEDANKSRPLWTETGASATAIKEAWANHSEGILHHFVILDPKWLSSAISCILRRDVRCKVDDTRKCMSSQVTSDSSLDLLSDSCSPSDVPLSNCPMITTDEVRLLWQSMSFMRDASEDIVSNASGCSNFLDSSLYEYLERVLVQSRVFLPLRDQVASDPPTKCSRSHVNTNANNSTLYLLPGLMSPDPPSDIWTYKAKDSWIMTLCHSWLFNDGVPPETMERVIGAVLQDLLNSRSKFACLGDYQSDHGTAPPTTVHQVIAWKSSFIIKLGIADAICPQTMERTESIVELFGHLTGAAVSSSGPPCVAANSMGSGAKRLTLSARGQAGDAGRKIWEGGLSLVRKSITSALREAQDGITSIEDEIVCPDCLSFQHPREASTWKADAVRSLKQKGHHHLRCGYGHNVEIALVCGTRPGSHSCLSVQETEPPQPPMVPVSNLLDGVVVVGLWDGEQIRSVGSGFIIDKELGLIATASHILLNMQSRERFGQELFGLKDAVIGIIPKSGSSKGPRNTTAVFRYFAEIVAHDVHNCDVCILRIATRFEEDVGGDGEGCGDQPEVLLKNNVRAMKAEELNRMKLTKNFELEEDVRILGYNQEGEGRLKPGSHVNRCADFARGYICKKFKISAEERVNAGLSLAFNPLEEIVVMCPTISGHSGGPCVNQKGDVIGILSRVDPADKQRCYLVPATEVKRLLKEAKIKCIAPWSSMAERRGTMVPSPSW